MKTNSFVFILFPPGFGGNHFLNLLGLYSGLSQPDEIIPLYHTKEINVHNDVCNLQRQHIANELQKKKDTLLFCGHIGEYLFSENFFSRFKDKRFITFNWTDADLQKLNDRLGSLNYKLFDDSYFREEQRSLYDAKNISKLVDCDHDDIAIVNLHDLISSDPVSLLDAVATKVRLPKGLSEDACISLHAKWLQSNKII